jgi:hypothetical protein
MGNLRFLNISKLELSPKRNLAKPTPTALPDSALKGVARKIVQVSI